MNTAKYAALFLTESRDNLVAVNEALLELERSPASSPHLDSVFRAVHTVKGMAGVMGYDAVVNLAHEMEALLAQARDTSRPLSPDDTALLFDAADALDSAIEQSVAGGEISSDVAATAATGWP